jgi:carbamoyltransferase
VIYERAAEIFVGDDESPYMLRAKMVRPEWRDRVAGIVHVDGTARVQTVREETNPKLYRLLREFEQLTGVPVLVNTSFNIKGEPIVEAPQDAMNCFMNTGIDYLALHDMLISKNRWHRTLMPFRAIGSQMSVIVQSGLEADRAIQGKPG